MKQPEILMATEADIEIILNALETTGQIFDGQIMATCPFHDDHSPSMRVNVNKNCVFICFSCGARGNFKKLANQLGVVVSGQWGEESIEVTMQYVLKILDTRAVSKTDHIQPENYLEQFNNPHPYWTERGYSEETIKQFELGYDFTADAVTIPVRNSAGELLGITRRFLDPNAESKYKYFTGFNRSVHLFGSWLVERDPVETVVLTEGSLDAISVWEAGYPGLAQYGAGISEGQVRLLSRLGPVRVVLMFDNDRAGERAKKRCLGLDDRDKYDPATDLTRRFDVYDVVYPKDRKDPGECTRDEIITMIEERRWLNSW